MTIKLDWPKDKAISNRIAEAHAEQASRKLEMGWMGRIFGSVANKPGNIAGFAIVAFSIMFAWVLLYGVDQPSLSKKEALTIVGGFISLVLGFIFGRATSESGGSAP